MSQTKNTKPIKINTVYYVIDGTGAYHAPLRMAGNEFDADMLLSSSSIEDAATMLKFAKRNGYENAYIAETEVIINEIL